MYYFLSNFCSKQRAWVHFRTAFEAVDHVKLAIAILDVPVLVTILGDETYPVL